MLPIRARVKDPERPVEINPTPINQSRVLVGTFSYSASLVAARMYDSDGCASLGTFLTPTHRTYSPIASARHHQFTCGRPALPPASSWTRGRSQSLGAGRPTKAISYLCLYNRTPTMSFRTRFCLPVRKSLVLVRFLWSSYWPGGREEAFQQFVGQRARFSRRGTSCSFVVAAVVRAELEMSADHEVGVLHLHAVW